MSIEEVKELLDLQHKGIEEFKRKHLKRVEELEQKVGELELEQARERIFGSAQRGSSDAKIETWIDCRTGKRIPVLAPDQKLASRATLTDDDGGNAAAEGFGSGVKPNVGRFLRGLVMGGKAHDARELAEERKALGIVSDPAGGFTIEGTLSLEWIDALRAQMVLSRAGARTIPMEAGEVALARVTGDPGVAWHAENALLSNIDPNFGRSVLRARTIVSVVRMSVELAQDSANIERALFDTMTRALAAAIDAAGISGADPNGPIGVLNFPERNRVLNVGTPANWDFAIDGIFELLDDNVPYESIGAIVAHPKLWQRMSKLKTGLSGDQTPLAMPEAIAARPRLFTTACPDTTAIIANWSDLLFGVRQQITVRVLDQSFMASNLQIAIVAYARVDFVPARPQSFCTLEGITYS